MFYLHECILLIYVDDVIIAAPTDEKLDEIIEIIKDNVDVEDQGDICDYVGVNFIQHTDGSFELQQPHLIRSILKDLHLEAENQQLLPLSPLSLFMLIWMEKIMMDTLTIVP